MGFLEGTVIRSHPMGWSFALCSDDAKQDPVVHYAGAELGVVLLLLRDPRTAENAMARVVIVETVPCITRNCILWGFFTHHVMYCCCYGLPGSSYYYVLPASIRTCCTSG